MNSTSSNPAADPAASGSPSFRPLYQQIKALITKSLQAGEWKPGEMMPSEVELAGRFKVSQGTVRKAIDELAAENLVVRRQGKGTFVAATPKNARIFASCACAPTKACRTIPKTASSKSGASGRRPRWRACST